MPVKAIIKDYKGERRDKLENFHGNQIVYLCWDHHLMMCAPVALPLSPDMPFNALISDVIPGAYQLHPEFSAINWDNIVWRLNGDLFEPIMDQALLNQGIDHKSILRFETPELKGLNKTGS